MPDPTPATTDAALEASVVAALEQVGARYDVLDCDPAFADTAVLVNNQGPHRTVVIAQRYYAGGGRARIPDPDPPVVGASDHVPIWCERNSIHPARMTVDFGDQCPMGPPAGPLRDWAWVSGESLTKVTGQVRLMEFGCLQA